MRPENLSVFAPFLPLRTSLPTHLAVGAHDPDRDLGVLAQRVAQARAAHGRAHGGAGAPDRERLAARAEAGDEWRLRVLGRVAEAGRGRRAEWLSRHPWPGRHCRRAGAARRAAGPAAPRRRRRRAARCRRSCRRRPARCRRGRAPVRSRGRRRRSAASRAAVVVAGGGVGKVRVVHVRDVRLGERGVSAGFGGRALVVVGVGGRDAAPHPTRRSRSR